MYNKPWLGVQAMTDIEKHVVCRQDEESQYRGLDPLLLLDTNRRLERVRWHPTNDNLFAAVAASDRSVYLYDAQYTQAMISATCLNKMCFCT